MVHSETEKSGLCGEATLWGGTTKTGKSAFSETNETVTFSDKRERFGSRGFKL